MHKIVEALEACEKLPVFLYDSPGSGAGGLQVSGGEYCVYSLTRVSSIAWPMLWSLRLVYPISFQPTIQQLLIVILRVRGLSGCVVTVICLSILHASPNSQLLAALILLKIYFFHEQSPSGYHQVMLYLILILILLGLWNRGGILWLHVCLLTEPQPALPFCSGTFSGRVSAHWPHWSIVSSRSQYNSGSSGTLPV